MRIIFFILILLLVHSSSFSQKTWLNVQDFGRLEEGSFITENIDGSFVISTHHTIQSNDTSQAALTKIDSNGNLIWFKPYVKNSCLGGMFKHIPMDSGYFCLSSIMSPNYSCNAAPTPPPVDPQILVIKTDELGNEILSQTYGLVGTNMIDDAREMIRANGKNFFIGGHQLYRPIIYKITENGDTLFTKKWTFGESITAMHKVNDNYFLATMSLNTAISLMAIDSLGNVLWTQYHSPYPCTNIKPTPDGNFILQINDYNTFRLIKVDVNGNLIWNKTFPGQEMWDLEVLNEEEYIITSFKGISKINSNQEVLWHRTPYPDTVFGVYDIHLVSDGGILITGSTKSLDFYVMKLDCDGNTEWNSESCSETINNIEILIYPNPATDILTIKLPQDMSERQVDIQIIDMLGRIVLNKSFYDSNTLLINLDNYSKGVYVVNVIQNNLKLKTEKIIKEQ